MVIFVLHLIALQNYYQFAWILLLFSFMKSFKVFLNIRISKSFRKYFREPLNCIDLLGSICLLIHCTMFLLRGSNNYLYRFQRQYSLATIIASISLLLRGVMSISPFYSKVRLLIGVFTQTFKDIGAFIMVFVYMIASMSVLHVVVRRTDK